MNLFAFGKVVWYGGGIMKWLDVFRVRDGKRRYRGGVSYEKEFDRWNVRKKRLSKRSFRGNKVPSWFREGEIWWCSIGINIGNEIDGKGKKFCRPILILKKLNQKNFIGLPLTRSGKNLPGYYKYKDDSYIILEQIRMISAKRLLRREKTLPSNMFAIIQEACLQYLFKR